MDIQQSALHKAIEIAGGQSALARAIRGEGRPVRQGHIWNWMNLPDKRVPPALAPWIEAATGVRCEDLRPDLQWIRKRGRVVAYAVPLET